MSIDCMAKGYSYQYLNYESILFGKTIAIPTNIINIQATGEGLTLDTVKGIVARVEAHEGQYALSGTANYKFQDEPGMGIFNIEAQFEAIELKE